MTSALHSPFALFRFALRERDWALAALLASSLGRTAPSRRRLAVELDQVSGAGTKPPSLLGLRVLARLVRADERSPRPPEDR